MLPSIQSCWSIEDLGVLSSRHRENCLDLLSCRRGLEGEMSLGSDVTCPHLSTGLPITFGIRDIEKIFSRHGEVGGIDPLLCTLKALRWLCPCAVQVKFVQIPHHRETGEPRGFCLIEFGPVKEPAADVLKNIPTCWAHPGTAQEQTKV